MTPMTPNVDDALALARAIGRADREAVDALLDDLGITSSEKAASPVGYLCGLLIGMAQIARGSDWRVLGGPSDPVWEGRHLRALK